MRGWLESCKQGDFFSEKVLRHELNTSLREQEEMELVARISQEFPHVWSRYIENNLDFQVGLHLICIAV